MRSYFLHRGPGVVDLVLDAFVLSHVNIDIFKDPPGILGFQVVYHKRKGLLVLPYNGIVVIELLAPAKSCN